MTDEQTAVNSNKPLRPQRPMLEVWSIAWPTVLTMASYSVMQFVDRLMVGQVGPLEVAAQGNGGIWSFAPIAFAMGALSVVNTFVSQHLGAGRPEEGSRYAWAAVWMSLIAWIVFFIPYALLLPLVFGLMGHDDDLRTLESHYAQIMLCGALLLMISRGLHHYFFGLHRPKVVTVSALTGNVANILANYTFIFGADGLPAMGLPGVPGMPALGLYGAALGTVTGIAVELTIPAAIFLGPRMHRELQTRAMWRPRWKVMKDLLRIGWPASVQFGNELTCWAIFMAVLVGHFGPDHMTAGWVAFGYMHLSFMPAVGFSIAITSVVGRYIGAGDPDTAVHRARMGVRLAMMYMTVCAAVFLIFRHELIGLFVGGEISAAHAERIIEIGGKLMICVAVFQTIDAFGLVYTGALRGAGDTVWPGVVTIILGWTLIIGGGTYMVAAWPQLESVGPWIAAAAYIIAFAIAMSWRFESGRWRRIRLIDTAGHDEPPATAPAAAATPISPGSPTGTADIAPADSMEFTDAPDGSPPDPASARLYGRGEDHTID